MKKERKTKEESKPKVLVVDDEESLRRLFERILRSKDYTLIMAKDGLEGIKRNEDSNPDVIILDLKMPQMDGIETLRHIRKTDKEVRVIILTGYGDAQTVREAADLDVYEYVTKPFSNEVAIKIIKEAFASREGKR